MEQFVAYFDAAGDRIRDRASADFDAAVLATRIGYVTAHDEQAARSWDAMRRQQRGPSGIGLEGQSLEQTMRMLAWQYHDIIAVVPSSEERDRLRSREARIIEAMRKAPRGRRRRRGQPPGVPVTRLS